MALPESLERALKDHLLRTDRQRTPVHFVGRRAELATLHATADQALKGVEGATTVVQGVPGMGKTALAAEFVRELEDRHDVFGVAIGRRFFSLPPLEMAWHITRSVAAGASGSLVERTLASILKDTSAGAIAGAAGAFFGKKSNLDIASQALGLDDESSLPRVFDAFADVLWPAGTAIVLVMDEAQAMTIDERAQDNLLDLHLKDSKANVVLAAFGLETTERMLRKAGLSRLAKGHVLRLGRLSESESEELTNRTLEALGLLDDEWNAVLAAQGWEPGEWADEARRVVVEESVGFPHHLTNSLTEVCQTVLAGAVAKERFAPALAAGCRKWKKEFYEARLTDFARHTLALGCFMDADGLGSRSSTFSGGIFLDFLGRAVDNRNRPIGEEQADTILDGLQSAGLLIKEQDATIRVAIPSMVDHLATQFRSSLTMAHPAALKLRTIAGQATEGRRS